MLRIKWNIHCEELGESSVAVNDLWEFARSANPERDPRSKALIMEKSLGSVPFEASNGGNCQ